MGTNTAAASAEELTFHDAPIAEIGPITVYQLLKLRVDVFVVEQHCPYPELDGRDVEAGARLLWAERNAIPIATLRLLTDPDGSARIGRVATVSAARSGGIATQLMLRALALVADRDVVLDAQIQLQGWYEDFGFRRDGADYDDDGIAHVPMRRRAN